jgi:hypothetical protein
MPLSGLQVGDHCYLGRSGSHRLRLRFSRLQLRLPVPFQRMVSETLLKQIPVNRLRRSSPLAGGDDHLAIGWCHTTGGIQSSHARPLLAINLYLT